MVVWQGPAPGFFLLYLRQLPYHCPSPLSVFSLARSSLQPRLSLSTLCLTELLPCLEASIAFLCYDPNLFRRVFPDLILLDFLVQAHKYTMHMHPPTHTNAQSCLFPQFRYTHILIDMHFHTCAYTQVHTIPLRYINWYTCP